VRRNCAEKIFGWLRNITNSAGTRLAEKQFGGGMEQVNKIWCGGARWRQWRRLRPEFEGGGVGVLAPRCKINMVDALSCLALTIR